MIYAELKSCPSLSRRRLKTPSIGHAYTPSSRGKIKIRVFPMGFGDRLKKTLCIGGLS